MLRITGYGLAIAAFAVESAPCRAQTRAPFPTLLAHYAARPHWLVAGVDKPVGAEAGTVMKMPVSLGGGVTLDRSRHLVHVTGDRVKLHGIDFAGDGGWGVIVEGRDDVIENCRFLAGSNALVPITGSAAATNLRIVATTIDGGGTPPASKRDALWALIDYQGHDLAVENSWMQFAPVDAIDFNGSGRLTVIGNLFNNLGYSEGAHADSVQFTHGHVDHAEISLNTVYDPQPVNGFPVLGGEGLQVEAQLGGVISNVTVTRNVIVATGPLRTAGFLIAIRQDAGSRLDGVEVTQNYLDSLGGWGAFYTPSGTNIRYSGNVDMRTGRIIPPPDHARQP